MKRISTIVLFITLLLSIGGCDKSNTSISTGLTSEEIIEGLKEALYIGSKNAVTSGGATDGYNMNQLIRIPFPQEAMVVFNTLNAIPGGDILTEAFIVKLNRTAEDAAEKALPIFSSAVTKITISDGLAILQGENDAATQYLRKETFGELKSAYQPDIEASLSSVGAQQAWEEIMIMYNNIPFVEPVNANLAEYTTNKALDGLFILTAQEEEKIRTDPIARITDILKKVFGY